MSVLRNLGYSALGQVARTGLGFANSVILARWLGPGEFGAYVVVITTMGLLSLVGGFGLQSALGYVAGKRKYPVQQITGHALWLGLAPICVLGLALGALPLTVKQSVLGDLPPYILWISFALTAPTLFTGLVNGTLLGLDRVRALVIISTAGAVLSTLLLVATVVALGMGLRGAMVQLAVSTVVTSIAGGVYLTRLTGVDISVNRGLVREVLAFGGKIYPGYVGYNLLNRIDVYFVNYFGGSTAAGIYAVAYGLAEKLWIVDQPVSQAIVPKVVGSSQVDAARLTTVAFQATFWTMVFAAGLVALAAPFLIPAVYGEEYTGAVATLLLLLPGAVCLSTRVISPYFSMQLGMPQIPTYYTAAVGVVSIPVYYFATRDFGYLGAAAASSIIYIGLGTITAGLFAHYTGTSLLTLAVPRREDLGRVIRAAGTWGRRGGPPRATPLRVED